MSKPVQYKFLISLVFRGCPEHTTSPVDRQYSCFSKEIMASSAEIGLKLQSLITKSLEGLREKEGYMHYSLESHSVSKI